MSIRTFTTAQLEAMGLPDDMVDAAYVAEHPEYTAEHPGAAVELHREYVESRRWESVNELVFRAPDDGKAYRVTYREPLTEMQESEPWNGADTVKAVEVEQRTVMTQAWQSVDIAPPSAAVQPRIFHLQRDHDVSGVSGTGRIADGVLWPDGTATLRWRGDRPSTVHWDRLDDAIAIHGHGGATRIVWADEQPAGQAAEAQPWPSVTDYALEVWETDMWVGITYKRKTLDEARERRDVYRRRFPNARFRIVRWDETSTVVESDPEAQQDGAQS